jgi:hypothetical protein
MAAHLLRSAAAPKDTSCQLISWLGVQVYSRASVLGFSKEELDDILQAIQPEDLQVSLPRPPLCLVLLSASSYAALAFSLHSGIAR